jgi:hypothetical protein
MTTSQIIMHKLLWIDELTKIATIDLTHTFKRQSRSGQLRWINTKIWNKFDKRAYPIKKPYKKGSTYCYTLRRPNVRRREKHEKQHHRTGNL